MQTEVSGVDSCSCPSSYSVAAAQAQSKIKILEKLPELQPPEASETETFRFAPMRPISQLLLMSYNKGFPTAKRSHRLSCNCPAPLSHICQANLSCRTSILTLGLILGLLSWELTVLESEYQF